VPAFYLRQPAAYSSTNGFTAEKIVQKSVSTDATGFQRDLYSFPALGPIGHDQHLESRFFQIVMKADLAVMRARRAQWFPKPDGHQDLMVRVLWRVTDAIDI
jgi:hypothetical protein